jgi:hypothetical protein
MKITSLLLFAATALLASVTISNTATALTECDEQYNHCVSLCHDQSCERYCQQKHDECIRGG